MTTLDTMNQYRNLQFLQKKITDIAKSYIGCPNSEYIAKSIKDNLVSQFDNLIDKAYNSKDDFDINVELPDADKLAESSDSYEEYKLKTAIATGDLPSISEHKFWEKHDPDYKHQMKVNVKIKKPAMCKWVNIRFNLDEYDNLNED